MGELPAAGVAVTPVGTAVGAAVGVAVGELQPMASAGKMINSIISAFLNMVSIIVAGFIWFSSVSSG